MLKRGSSKEDLAVGVKLNNWLHFSVLAWLFQSGHYVNCFSVAFSWPLTSTRGCSGIERKDEGAQSSFPGPQPLPALLRVSSHKPGPEVILTPSVQEPQGSAWAVIVQPQTLHNFPVAKAQVVTLLPDLPSASLYSLLPMCQALQRPIPDLRIVYWLLPGRSFFPKCGPDSPPSSLSDVICSIRPSVTLLSEIVTPCTSASHPSPPFKLHLRLPNILYYLFTVLAVGHTSQRSTFSLLTVDW